MACAKVLKRISVGDIVLFKEAVENDIYDQGKVINVLDNSHFEVEVEDGEVYLVHLTNIEAVII